MDVNLASGEMWLCLTSAYTTVGWHWKKNLMFQLPCSNTFVTGLDLHDMHSLLDVVTSIFFSCTLSAAVTWQAAGGFTQHRWEAAEISCAVSWMFSIHLITWLLWIVLLTAAGWVEVLPNGCEVNVTNFLRGIASKFLAERRRTIGTCQVL